MNALVSLVTPCYNVEKKIPYFLDSLLSQTYTNVEVIFVDDGSTDKTKDVIFSYRERIEESGMSFRYIYQENQGAAGAVANGLRYVTGKYLIWPDADDVLMPTSIEKRVDFLEEHPEYGIVRTNAYIVNPQKPDDKEIMFSKKHMYRRSEIFRECIRFYTKWCSCSYMVQFERFLESNPDRYIYPTKAGQNIQMLIPIVYHSKCAFMDEPLCVYMIYDDSHSHSNGYSSYNKKLKSIYELEEVTLNTIEKLNLGNRRDRCNVINDFAVRRFCLAYNENKIIEKVKFFKELSKFQKINPLFILSKYYKNKLLDYGWVFYNKCKYALFVIANRK